MPIPKTVVTFLVAAAAASTVLAEPGEWKPGELGFVPAQPKSTLTRDQVKKDLLDFLKRGGQIASGERDYFEPTTFDVRTAQPAVNTRQLGAPPAVDPYANGGPN
jgi:hypothetical protein